MPESSSEKDEAAAATARAQGSFATVDAIGATFWIPRCLWGRTSKARGPTSQGTKLFGGTSSSEYRAPAGALFRSGLVFSDVVAGQVPAARRDQLVDLLRSPGAGPVRDRPRRILQQRLRDLPEALDRLRAAEQRPVAHHHVVDQALVGVQRLAGAAEGVGVAEAHVRLPELDPRAGDLGEEGGGDAAGVAELEGEVVVAEGLGDLVAVEREHPPRRLLVGDRQQVTALGQALAGAQVEGHALPAPVVDKGLDRDEGLGVGVGGDAVLLA